MEFDSHFTMVHINPGFSIALFFKALKETEGFFFTALGSRFIIAHFEMTLDTFERNILRNDTTSSWFRWYIFDSCWENAPHMGVGGPDKIPYIIFRYHHDLQYSSQYFSFWL